MKIRSIGDTLALTNLFADLGEGLGNPSLEVGTDGDIAKVDTQLYDHLGHLCAKSN